MNLRNTNLEKSTNPILDCEPLTDESLNGGERIKDKMVVERTKKNPDKDYQWLKMSDVLNETVYAHKAIVSDVKTESKFTKTGKQYISNLFRINFYNEDDKTNVCWWIQAFYEFDGTNLTVNEKSELYDFVCQITGDYGSSKFVLDFEAFQEAVSELTDIAFKVEEITNDAGFTKYVPSFLGVQ